MKMRSSQEDLSAFFNQVFDQQFDNIFAGQQANQPFVPFQFVIEEDGKVLAAVKGESVFQSLRVSELAVASDQQGRGLGSRLLDGLKAYCQENSLTKIILTTRSYQAKGFYLKNGFEIFGHLEDVPFAGVSTYYLCHQLSEK